MTKRIFVSHAVKDKALADAFVDLLQTGANIPSNEIFCSSLEGLGIPSGENFVEHIKSQIQAPEVVVAIVSKNYFASQFCLCELGATWAMSHKILPLLVPPLKYSDVQGVLTATQLSKIDDSDSLNQFAEELTSIVSSSKLNIARWGVKKKRFLESLPAVLAKLENPNVVAFVEHSRVLKELNDTKSALEEMDAENESLKSQVAQLSVCKDKAQVKAVNKKFSSADDTLHELFATAAEHLAKLPRAVSFVAYRFYSSGAEAFIDPFKDKDTSDEAGAAIDSQLLEDIEGRYSLNRSHPKIRKLVKSLDELRDYIDNEAPSELVESYEDDHDLPLTIENRDVWESELDSRLKRVYA